MKIPILTSNDIIKNLTISRKTNPQPFLAMYSSWLGGIITDTPLMILPIDDHLVHRGDGIFEAMKLVNGKIYLYEEHLTRLFDSAEKCSLKIPNNKTELKNLISETVLASKSQNATIRMFISRGPGGFTPNPYDSVGPQVYIVVTEPKPFDPKKIESGVTVGLSKIPMKEPFFATVKSCNYLNNVLMKKEAVDNGWDFSINVSPAGFIGEGSTENIALITQKNEFLVPSFKYTLKGTTLIRLMHLSRSIVKEVGEAHLTADDFCAAKEVFMCGTTMGVVAVTKFNEKTIGNGKPGPRVAKFRELMAEDITAMAPEC